MISDLRVAFLKDRIERRVSKPDVERRLALQLIDRMEVAEAALLDLYSNIPEPSRTFTPEERSLLHRQTIETRLRKEGKIR